MKRLAWAALAIAITAVSWASILARLASVHGAVAAWWRLAIGTVVTIAAAYAVGSNSFSTSLLRYPLVAGIALSLHFTLWLESLNHTSVAVSTSIVSTYPVFTFIFEYRRKRLNLLRAVGVAATVSGVVLAARPWKAPLGHIYGVLLALGGSVAGSIYFYVGRVARSQGYHVIPYTLHTYAAALLTTSLTLLVLGINPLSVRAESMPYLILLGIVPMILGHTMVNLALRYLSATLVTSMLLLEPFGASALALLVLAETPHPLTIPAMALTVGGAIAVAYTEEK